MIIPRDTFSKAFQAYSQTFRFIPWTIALREDQIRKIKPLSLEYFEESEDGEQYILSAPIEAWSVFSASVRELALGRISIEGLDNAIQFWIKDRGEFDLEEVVFSDFQQYLFTWLSKTCQTTRIVYVPVHNIALGHNVDQVILGNTTLRRGLPVSESADQMQDLPEPETLKEGLYLSLEASGDHQTLIQTVKMEANRALAVLRFVSSWDYKLGEIDTFPENKARYVSLQQQTMPQMVYLSAGSELQVVDLGSDDEGSYYFDVFALRNAEDLYGLNDINYHFQHEENEISSWIIRAVEMYDSGVQASSKWQALYRYVIAINALVHHSKSDIHNILPRLKTLLEYGGNFVVSTRNMTGEAKNMTAMEFISHIADPFKNFYVLRGGILHGDVIHPTNDQVEDTRIIAHNVIRLAAKLAKEFNWQNKKEVDRWFKSPSRPHQ